MYKYICVKFNLLGLSTYIKVKINRANNFAAPTFMQETGKKCRVRRKKTNFV